MRTVSNTAVYERTDRASWVRVEVDRTGSGDWVDLSDLEGYDWVVSVSYNDNVDINVTGVTVTLRRQIEHFTISPFMTGSKLNVGGTLLQIRNPVRVYAAVVAMQTEPTSSDWLLIMDGQIEEVDWGTTKVRVEVQDQSAEIQQKFIEDKNEYGLLAGREVKDVINDILSDNGLSAYALPSGDAIGFDILPYFQRKESVLAACQNLARQAGGATVKWVWDETASEFQFRLFTYDRAKTTPDDTINADLYLDVTQLSVSRRDVRNRVRVWYTDTSDVRTSVVSEDTASQTLYGVKYCDITEASSSQIDTSGEASDLADAILADLKDPGADQVVSMRFDPRIELGDLIRYEANGVHYDTDQDWAVVAVDHNIVPSGASTTSVTVRGAPSSGVLRWLETQAAPGLAPEAPNNDIPGLDNPAIETGQGSLFYSYDDPRTMSPAVKDWAYTIIEIAPDVTGSPGTYAEAARGKQTRFELTGLTPGSTYWIRGSIITESGAVGATIAGLAKAVQYTSPYHLNSESKLSENYALNFDFGSTLGGTTVPPDRWEAQLDGVWDTNIELENSTTFSGENAIKMTTDGATVEDIALFQDTFVPIEYGTVVQCEMRCRASVDTSGTNLTANAWLYLYDSSYTQVAALQLCTNKEPDTTYKSFKDSVHVTSTSAKFCKVAIITSTTVTVPAATDVYYDSVRVYSGAPIVYSWADSGTVSTTYNAVTMNQQPLNVGKTSLGSDFLSLTDTNYFADCQVGVSGLPSGQVLDIRLRNVTDSVDVATASATSTGAASTYASLRVPAFAVTRDKTYQLQARHDHVGTYSVVTGINETYLDAKETFS